METQDIQYALISFDKLNLLIPQADISTIDTLDKITSNNDSDNDTPGQFNTETGDWPVFSISADFIKVDNIRESDRYCVCFKHPEHGLFGLVCNTVSSFHYDENNAIQTNLPKMMILPQSPIQKIVHYQNSLYLMSNVNSLYHSLVEVE